MKSYFQKIYSFCFVFFCILVSSNDVIVTWNPNNEKDLAGYKIYYGTSSRHYSTVFDVGDNTSYLVPNLTNGVRYFFAVTAYDTANNESEFSDEVSIFIDNNANSPTDSLNLKCYNFPNPFNPQKEVTRIRYYLQEAQNVSIDIYDANENLVSNLLNKIHKSSGEHTEDIWDGKNNNGHYVPNGVYYGVIKLDMKQEIIMIAITR